MLVALGWLLLLGAFACKIIILISAFQDEIWKGIVGLFCDLYLLYYAIVEWENTNKWLIFGLWLGLSFVGWALLSMGGASALGTAPGAGLTPDVR